MQHGHWSVDVAYHIASALEPETRATEERGLLAYYLDALGEHGVEAPSRDAAWADYRFAMPYGFFLWGITLYVQPDIISELIYRLGTAVSDLESYEVAR